jgi:CBS domain containing-hemolysin-like protein
MTPSYVRQQVQANPKIGAQLEKYKEDVDIPLSGILTLNTIAHTVGAILVGVQAGELFGEGGFEVLGININFETIVATLMTLAILILSEIIPKTIGANYWRQLGPFTVKALRIIIFILYPLVWLSKLITSKLKSDKSKSVLSRADFMAIATVGEESGAIGKEESQIITNLLNFEKRKVRDIMTPRTVAFMAQEDETLKSFIENPETSTYSRIPVFGEDKDHIVGMVLKVDIFNAYLNENGQQKLIKEILRPVNFVSDQTRLHDYFILLTNEKQHLSIVKDEFGNVVGLVTMEDLFETLLGREILDESDKVADLQALAKKRAVEDNP